MFRTVGIKILLVVVLWLSVSFDGFSQEAKRKISIEDATSFHRFYMKLPQGIQWLPDVDQYSYIKRDMKTRSAELWLYNARTQNEKKLLSTTELKYVTEEGDTLGLTFWQYHWLPQRNGVVFKAKNDLWVYLFEQKEILRLTNNPEEEEEVDISPDGKYVSFVKGNNLFVVPTAGGEEVQLTFDGNDIVLNGKLDWVYQEELVGRGKFKGYFWSPRSDQIAYLQFDQTQVPVYPLVDWSEIHPKVDMMRYPKAGDPNSVVKLGVVTLNNPQTIWINTGNDSDIYIPRVYWLPSGRELAFMTLDRHQQHLEFLFADPETGESRVVLSETDPYWINIGDYVHFFKKKKLFLWASERGGYNHLYLYDYKGKLKKQLTSGDWEVKSLSGVDEKGGWVYFTSNRDNITETQLYRVKLNGKSLQRVTRTEGSHRIRMANTCKFFLDYRTTVQIPMTLGLFRADGKEVAKILEDDGYLEQFEIVEPEIFTFEEGGITYYASMIKPADFDSHRQYPVLIYVYGGPHAQVVRNSFGSLTLWHQMLAQEGYIVFSMDNRGSSGRGHQWETPIYKQMGKVELEDQLKGVRYLKSLPYVDKERIGIWGWSYGGYMTLYALTHSKEFRAGVSVAPVTNWRFYDTIYTERYMSLPQDNEEGYRNSSPVFFADSLHGALLLIHGTGDDNVHVQNSVEMVDALVDAGKQFELMFYPNQRHGISSPADRLHLFRKMKAFLDENLKGE